MQKLIDTLMRILFKIFFFVCCYWGSLQAQTTTIDLHRATIQNLQEWMTAGEVSSEDIVRYYLDRIKNFDQAGPQLNSVLVLNPDALHIARAMDMERRNGQVRGPMHGIPVLIKDNIDTHDKMPTTGGSILLQDNFVSRDAFIVRKLRESGAVLLGKTNLSEWANFRSTNSSSGWSSAGGQTKNPFDTLMSPCGSSSGSGVAVAADFCAAAIGTETDGSIACPSAVNGIVGIKPTVGLWSRSGIIPISHTQDTPGPMARTVMDAATLLSACAGIDEGDTATLGLKKKNDYTIYCRDTALENSRLGVDITFLNGQDTVSKIFQQALKKMEQAGAQIIPLNYAPLLKGIGKMEFDILLYEFKHGITKYLLETNLPYQNLQDLILANEEGKAQTMPFFGQEIFQMAEDKGSLMDSAYQAALINCTERSRRLIDSLMTTHQLTAIVGPALGAAWKIDHEHGDHSSGPSSYSIASRSGYPSITVPSAMINGLPLALCFMGRAYQEDRIIGLAYAFEQKFGPKLLTGF
ncbi:MAG: amidase [Saprospiraceae bacterium]|nr:amidase [Saprospiraceae bacterium]